MLTEGQHFKEGGDYFEVREIIHVRFQKFVSFTFKIKLEVYHNDKKPYIFQISSYFNYLINTRLDIFGLLLLKHL